MPKLNPDPDLSALTKALRKSAGDRFAEVKTTEDYAVALGSVLGETVAYIHRLSVQVDALNKVVANLQKKVADLEKN